MIPDYMGLLVATGETHRLLEPFIYNDSRIPTYTTLYRTEGKGSFIKLVVYN